MASYTECVLLKNELGAHVTSRVAGTQSMPVHLTPIPTLPKPEGATPFVVSSDIFIRLAYPVARRFPVAAEMVEPLGKRTADSIQAFFSPAWPYRTFEKDWLYAIC